MVLYNQNSMSKSKKFLPFALPDIGEEEIAEVVDTLKSGWLTTGRKTMQFEKAFAELIGVKHALALNSGTAALHLALEALGVGPEDKVITSVYTFTASAEIIRYLEAEPLFVDINPETFNLDVNLLEKTIRENQNVKVIIPVHIAGQACDMNRILEIADRYSLKVVEDAAHALPTTFDQKFIGNHGDLTAYSFYATKTITTGEGGMVVTDNGQYAERIRTMRLHGINSDVFDRYTSDKPKWYYEVVAPGFKYNMTDVAASLGIHQLNRVHDFQKKRASIARQYTDAFQNLPLKLPVVARPADTHSWHLYMIQLDLDQLTISRDQFIEFMSEKGIGTSVHFIPLHLQPYWRDRYGFDSKDFPKALHVFERVVSLPIYTRMTDEQVDRVIAAVRKILSNHRI